MLYLKGVLGFSMASMLAPLMLVGIFTMVVTMIFDQAMPSRGNGTASAAPQPRGSFSSGERCP